MGESASSSGTPGITETVRRWTILLGVVQITVGCLIGMAPPTSVPWFRGLVMAHLEFTANGVLLVVLGLIVRELTLGAPALRAWFVLLQTGTWTNGAAGIVAALTGASAPLLPTANAKFPPPHGTDNPVVSVLLIVCAICMLAALGMTLVGLARRTKTSA